MAYLRALKIQGLSRRNSIICNEIDLCKLFRSDPKTLQLQFGDIYQDILRVFNLINSGNIPDTIHNSAQIPNFQDVTQHSTTVDMSAVG